MTLSIQELEDCRAENFAEDIPIPPEATSWTYGAFYQAAVFTTPFPFPCLQIVNDGADRIARAAWQSKPRAIL